MLFQRLDGKKRLMVRKPALRLINELRSVDHAENESPKLIVLSSEGVRLTKRGVGKVTANGIRAQRSFSSSIDNCHICPRPPLCCTPFTGLVPAAGWFFICKMQSV
jgi:hypothetical protein